MSVIYYNADVLYSVIQLSTNFKGALLKCQHGSAGHLSGKKIESAVK